MIGLSKKRSGSDVQVILVLQSDQAHWYKLSGPRIVDYYCEPIVEYRAQPVLECPWVKTPIDDEPLAVQLILDTTMDEVDRVGVEQSASAVVNRYRQMRTVARLRADFPKAQSYALPDGYADQVAALMHLDISQQWSEWLLAVQAWNVRFVQVATASELVARWSRDVFEEPTLLVMPVADYQRHLLVDRGCILFLRTVPMNDAQSSDDFGAGAKSEIAVAQSISHLRSVIPQCDDGDVRVVSNFLEIDPIDAESVSNVSLNVTSCNGEQSRDGISGPADVCVLLRLFLGHDIAYSESIVGVEDCLTRLDDGKEPASTSTAKSENTKTRRLAGEDPRTITTRILSVVGSSTIVFKRQPRWLLSRSGVQQLSALLPSLEYEKACGQLRLMFRLSVLMATMATIGAGAAFANGIASARRMNQHEQLYAGVEKAVVDAYTSASAFHAQPRLAAESLVVADLLSQSSTASPERILSGVAKVVSTLPSVSIDRLAWAVVEADENYESFTHALAAVPSLGSVESIVGVWTVQVDMSGSVAGDTLSLRKRELDQLLDELNKLDGALDIVIVESPVDLALSSSTDSELADQYRLTMKFGGA